MPAKQSLDEPMLPQMANYFEAMQTVDPYHGEIYLLQNKVNPNFKLDMKVQTLTDYKSYETTEKQYQILKYHFSNPHLVNIHCKEV